MKSHADKFNRILGSLIGFAIGDAMGATTEFMTPEQIVRSYGTVDSIIGGGWLNLSPGETTDDTDMMTCVAEAYLAAISNSSDFETNCCRNFEFWYNTNPKDIGNVCRKAIASSYGKDKEAWLENSMQINHDYPSLGNGALMRCLFPALMNDSAAALSQGRLTHNNPESDKYIQFYVNLLQHYLRRTAITSKPAAHTDPSGRVSNSFMNAAHWAAEKTFKSAILGAVNDGGDADTIAALTGGLAGARFGFYNIPTDWVNQLQQDTYNKLRILAEKATEILITSEEETL